MEVSGWLYAPAALLLREKAPGNHWIGGWTRMQFWAVLISKFYVHLNF